HLTGHVGHRSTYQIDESARLKQKGVGVRWLPFDVPAHALSGGCRCEPLDQGLERHLTVTIVEADVEACARLGRNKVDDGVADVNVGKLEIGAAEMGAAVIKRGGHERAHEGYQPAH